MKWYSRKLLGHTNAEAFSGASVPCISPENAEEIGIIEAIPFRLI